MDIEVLTLDRFRDLADAYGGDVARWPEAERRAAVALVEAEPSVTAILEGAAALDRLLDASPAPVAPASLRAAIVAAAPRPRGRRAIGRRWVGVGLGASLAAASVAGILTGAAAAPIAASHLRIHTADAAGEAARWLGEPADVTEG